MLMVSEVRIPQLSNLSERESFSYSERMQLLIDGRGRYLYGASPLLGKEILMAGCEGITLLSETSCE